MLQISVILSGAAGYPTLQAFFVDPATALGRCPSLVMGN